MIFILIPLAFIYPPLFVPLLIAFIVWCVWDAHMEEKREIERNRRKFNL